MNFVNSTIILITGQTFSSVFLFLSRVILARMLGPRLTGAFGLALNATTISSRWLSVGIGPAVQYYASKDSISHKNLFRSCIIMGLFLGAAANGVVWLFMPFLKHHFFRMQPEAFKAFGYMTTFLITVMLAMIIPIFLLGRNRYFEYTFTQFFPEIVFLIVLSLAVYFGSGLQVAVLAQLLLWLSMVMIGLFYLRDFWHGGRMNLLMMRDLLSYGLRAWPLVFLQFGIAKLAIFLGGSYLRAADMGQYIVASNTAEALFFFQAVIGQILLTNVSKNDAKIDETVMCIMRISIWVSLSVVLLTAITGRSLYILVYGEVYQSSWGVFLILMLTSLCHGTFRLHLNYLAGRGRPLKGTAAQTIELISLVLLMPLMLNKLNILGLATATFIASICGLIASTIFTKRISGRSLMEMFQLRWADIALLKLRILSFKLKNP